MRISRDAKMRDKIKLIAIAGPTASGKTDLALFLSEALGGEIISADSMQVYRFMDIGTAKPGKEARAKTRHHLIDIISPDEEYSAARYRQDALDAIRSIAGRNRLPIIAGGTGLYIKALTRGLFKGPGRDEKLRQGLVELAGEKGRDYLHGVLNELDPASAEQIHPNNIARVIRAIEVCRTTGAPVSRLRQEHGFSEDDFDVLMVGLLPERDALYRAIEERVDGMLKTGLVDETRSLLSMGYGAGLKSMRSIGYREIALHINERLALKDAADEIKKNTRHFAKRQITWFKQEPRLTWFKPFDTEAVKNKVREFLN